MNAFPLNLFASRAALLNSAMLCASSAAFAADGTWTGNAAGNWSDPLNWNSGVVADDASFTALFNSDITAATVVKLDTARTIGNLTFSDNGANSVGTAFSNNFGINSGVTLSLSGGFIKVNGELRSEMGTNATGSYSPFGSGSITANSGTTLRFRAGSTNNTYTIANAINLNSATLAYEDGNHTMTGTVAAGAELEA